ncbi:MAG: alpha/beta hydrolase [Hyphomicrobiaceae bacterium]|nr:alpha/beta hydrolase [Hyphomicrobiaceae bacterium]
MLVQIVKGTPPWVWVILVGLIVLGAVQLRDREMSRPRLLALPLVMVVLSLLATASAFELAPAALMGWALGGAVAVLVLRPSAAPVNMRTDGRYRVAGSWWPLLLILCIFSIRYVVSAVLVIDPSSRQLLPFQAAAGLLSGTFAGLFLGRAFAALGIGRGRGLIRWATAVAVLALLPLGVALALVAWPLPAEETEQSKPSQELETFMRTAPRVAPGEALYFKARDGADRLYRRYDGSGPDVLVLFHGSTGDSRYLAWLSRRIAGQTGLTVVTPDMRGHGPAPGRRGDAGYVGQQEHDVADLLATLRDRSFKRVFLGGHSLGGGLAIRYAAGSQVPRPDGLILLAPFVNQGSPAAFPGAGGWATAFMPRFVGLSLLHRYGISAFDHLAVLRFRTSPSSRDGSETSLYSWRLWTSLAPRDAWRKEIASLACPVLVIGAAEDPFFRSEGYPEVFKLAAQAEVEIVPRLSHFHLVVDEGVPGRIARWLQQAPARSAERGA